MRPPIGTDSKGAREYLGCSQSMFEQLRASRLIRSLRRDWYSYDDLDDVIRLLRTERDNRLQQNHGESTESLSGQESAKPLGRKGHRSDYPKTEELLRRLG